MKILFDTSVFCAQRYGGVSRYHIELAKRFQADYSDTVVIPACVIRNAYLAEYVNKPLKNIRSRLVNAIINRVNTVSTIVTVMLKKHDIVHLTWYYPRIIKAVKNKRSVITIHDMIQEIYNLDPLTVEYKKQAIYAADGIIAISQSTKNDILHFYPDILEDKIKVIYHGTNHLGQAVRPTTFILPEKYVLYVGARSKYKNAHLLMEAFADKLKQDQDLHLVFAGGGPFSEEEGKILEQLGIRNKVIQQYVTDGELAYMYAHARCFIYPSLYEGFGFPILEAFDNNCPVICSHSSSLPEVGGDAALYFAPDNKEDLQEKIDFFLDSEEHREQYIQRGKIRVSEFTWKNAAAQTRAFYQEILQDEQ